MTVVIDAAQALIRQALRTQLLTISGLDANHIAWQGRVYKPGEKTADDPWLREVLKHATTSQKSLGPRARVRQEGVWFLDYFHLAGVGMSVIDAAVGVLLAAFPAGGYFSASGLTVTVKEAFRSAELEEARWIMSPVRVRWYADTYNLT